MWETVDAKGEIGHEVSGVLKWNDGLFLSTDLAPPGQYETIVVLDSLSGEQAVARHSFKVQARDDDLAKAIAQAPVGDYIPENFIGEWEIIDAAAWFQQGKVVSMGAFKTYEPYPGHPNLLRFRLFKPRGRNLLPGLDMVDVIETVGLPHTRQYVLDEKGQPRPEYGVRMALPIFDRSGGLTLMISMDLFVGDVGVAVKRSGPEPNLQPPTAASAPSQPQRPGRPSRPGTAAPPQSPAPTANLDGSWQGVSGEVVVIEGDKWALFQSGQITDGGVFSVQGNRITTQSAATGDQAAYLFQLRGDRLLLQDASGAVYQYSRMR